MLNPKIAARIARAHGLSLADASALARMADSAAEAEQVAQAFTAPPPAGVVDRTAEPTSGDQFAHWFGASVDRRTAEVFTDRGES